MFCSKCGCKLNNEALFCHNCGEKVSINKNLENSIEKESREIELNRTALKIYLYDILTLECIKNKYNAMLYKIKKQFKILDFSGKKIYLEKGASDSIFEISDTMEELLFLLKDGITLEEIYKYFLKQYAVNDEYLRAAISSTIDILSKKGIIERYVSK